MNKNFFLGLMIGAAAGLSYGLLYAPESGKKTRKRLNKFSKKLNNKVDDFIANSQNTIVDVRESIEEVRKKAEKKLAQMNPLL